MPESIVFHEVSTATHASYVVTGCNPSGATDACGYMGIASGEGNSTRSLSKYHHLENAIGVQCDVDLCAS
jgi:hypothetical protein